ncbi:MAG: tryptophan synthase subunit beta [Candidatus Riflebacteria bacterium]|nr:tryptophan synthase subunit beta [Candidatus Riflebacteria bacterium]
MKPPGTTRTSRTLPDVAGYFGAYGGRFVPETLIAPLEAFERAYRRIARSGPFRARLTSLLEDYCGRPTPLFFASRLSRHLGGCRVFLKREDLLHTGAHKINNALGQALVAQRMGKTRIVAETGAGQHGLATATASAMLGLECRIFMGTEDMRRQALNVSKMRLLGAEVVGVDTGSRTLKDAINEAIRDWLANVDSTHYLLGSVLGPHPYPMVVRDFQSVIGREARVQIRRAQGRLPDRIVACVGGGSNAMGIFFAFLGDRAVRLEGVEAAGQGLASGHHAARFVSGEEGVLHGTRSLVLQTPDGQIGQTHSIAPGLDYAAVGPEHVFYQHQGRIAFASVDDGEALAAFRLLTRLEGIIPALESAHAVAHLLNDRGRPARGEVVIVNLSGRGDKDVPTLAEAGNLHPS